MAHSSLPKYHGPPDNLPERPPAFVRWLVYLLEVSLGGLLYAAYLFDFPIAMLFVVGTWVLLVAVLCIFLGSPFDRDPKDSER